MSRYSLAGHALDGDGPSQSSLIFNPLWAVSAWGLTPRAEGASSSEEPSRPYWERWVRDRIANQARLHHVLYLRRESERMRATIDLDVLTALMLGRIEFRYTPDNARVRAVFERIYHAIAAPLWEIAFRDFLIAGVGGIGISLLGVRPLRPELTVAYPNWHRPRWTGTLIPLHLNTARRLFKHPVWAQYQRQKNLSKTEDAFVEDRAMVVVLEVMDDQNVFYYFGDVLLKQIPREARYGHFLFIGDERPLSQTLTRHVDSSQGYGEYRRQRELLNAGTYYVFDKDPDTIDFPVGMLEKCVRTQYRGYNLYEAHERLTESFLKESLKGRYALYQFDVFDEDSQSFHEFEEIFHAIGYNNPEPAKTPPITFLGGVSMQEIQVGLREVENALAAITGVNPYMLGQVGVTKVASEVVAMQQSTNLKLQAMHEQVARTLDPFVRAFHLYLMMLPESNQVLIIEPYETPDGQQRYVAVGTVGSEFSSSLPIDFVSYDDFLSECRIELAYTGHVSLIERRQNYMNALNLLTSILPIAAQYGVQYNVPALIERILSDLGVDLRELRTAPNSALMPPALAQPAAAGSEEAMLAMLQPAPDTPPPLASDPSASELPFLDMLLQDSALEGLDPITIPETGGE